MGNITRNAHSDMLEIVELESWPVDIFVLNVKHDFWEIYTPWQHTLNM